MEKSEKVSGSFSAKREKHSRRPMKIFKRFFKNKKPKSRDSVQDQPVTPVLDQTPVHCCKAPELEDKVRELERLLCKADRDHKQQKQYYTEMKEIFQEKEKLLKDSLVYAKLKYQEEYSLESSLMKKEKSVLMQSVNTLQSKVQKLEKELHHTRLQRDKLQTDYNQLRVACEATLDEHEEMKKKLMHKDKKLKDSMADAKLKRLKTLESISHLEEEKLGLMDSVITLQSKVEELEKELHHTRLQRDKLENDYNQLRLACEATLDEHEEMKKKLMHKDKKLEDSLADAKLKHQEALRSISYLKELKSGLMDSVNILHSRVEELEKELHHTRLQRDKLQTAYEQQQESHGVLQLEYEDTKETEQQSGGEKLSPLKTLDEQFQEDSDSSDAEEAPLMKSQVLQSRPPQSSFLKTQQQSGGLKLPQLKTNINRGSEDMCSSWIAAVDQLFQEDSHSSLSRSFLKTQQHSREEKLPPMKTNLNRGSEEMCSSRIAVLDEQFEEDSDSSDSEEAPPMKSRSISPRSSFLEILQQSREEKLPPIKTNINRGSEEMCSSRIAVLGEQFQEDSDSSDSEEVPPMKSRSISPQSSFLEILQQSREEKLPPIKTNINRGSEEMCSSGIAVLDEQFEEDSDSSDSEEAPPMKSRSISPRSSFLEILQQSREEKLPPIKTNINRGSEEMCSSGIAVLGEQFQEDSDSSDSEEVPPMKSRSISPRSSFLEILQQSREEKLPPIKTNINRGSEEMCSSEIAVLGEQFQEDSDSSDSEEVPPMKSQSISPRSSFLEILQQSRKEKLPPIKTNINRGSEEMCSSGIAVLGEQFQEDSDSSDSEEVPPIKSRSISPRSSFLEILQQSREEKLPPLKTNINRGSEEMCSSGIAVLDEQFEEDSDSSDSEEAPPMKSRSISPQSSFLEILQQSGEEKLPPIKTNINRGSEEMCSSRIAVLDEQFQEDSDSSDSEEVPPMKSRSISPRSSFLEILQQSEEEKLPPIKTNINRGSEEMCSSRIAALDEQFQEDSDSSNAEEAPPMKSRSISPQSSFLEILQQSGEEKLPPIKTNINRGSEEMCSSTIAVLDEQFQEDSDSSDSEEVPPMKSRSISPRSSFLEILQQSGEEKLPPIKTNINRGSEEMCSSRIAALDKQFQEDSDSSDSEEVPPMKSRSISPRSSFLEILQQSGEEKLPPIKTNINRGSEEMCSSRIAALDEQFQEDSDSSDVEEAPPVKSRSISPPSSFLEILQQSGEEKLPPIKTNINRGSEEMCSSRIAALDEQFEEDSDSSDAEEVPPMKSLSISPRSSFLETLPQSGEEKLPPMKTDINSGSEEMWSSWVDESDNSSLSDLEKAPPMKSQSSPSRSSCLETLQQSGKEKLPPIKTNINSGSEEMYSSRIATLDEQFQEDSDSSDSEEAPSMKSQSSTLQSRFLETQQQFEEEKLPPMKTDINSGSEEMCSSRIIALNEQFQEDSDSSDSEEAPSMKSRSISPPSSTLKLQQQSGVEKLPPIKTNINSGSEEMYSSRIAALDEQFEYDTDSSDSEEAPLMKSQSSPSQSSFLKTLQQSRVEKLPPITTYINSGSEEMYSRRIAALDEQFQYDTDSSDSEEAPSMKSQSSPSQSRFLETQQQSEGEKLPPIKTNINSGSEEMYSSKIAALDEQFEYDTDSSDSEEAPSMKSQSGTLQSRFLETQQQFEEEKLPPMKTNINSGSEEMYSSRIAALDEQFEYDTDSSDSEEAPLMKSQSSPSQSSFLETLQQSGVEKLPPITTNINSGSEEMYSKRIAALDEQFQYDTDSSDSEEAPSMKSQSSPSQSSCLETLQQSGVEKLSPIKTNINSGSEKMYSSRIAALDEQFEYDIDSSDSEEAPSIKSRSGTSQSGFLETLQQSGVEKLPPIKTNINRGSEEMCSRRIAVLDQQFQEDSDSSDSEEAPSMKSQSRSPQSSFLETQQQSEGEKLPPMKTDINSGSEEMLSSWEDESDNCSSSDAEEAPPMKSQSRSPQSSFPETQQQSEGEKLPPIKTNINSESEEMCSSRIAALDEQFQEDSYSSDSEEAPSMKSQSRSPQSSFLETQQQSEEEKLPPMKTDINSGSEEMLSSWEDESDNCSSSDAEEAPPMKSQSRSPQSSFPETQQQSEGEKLPPMKTNINSESEEMCSSRIAALDEQFQEDSYSSDSEEAPSMKSQSRSPQSSFLETQQQSEGEKLPPMKTDIDSESEEMLSGWEDESDNCSSSDAEEAPPMKSQSRSPQSSFPETQQQYEGEKLPPMKTNINSESEEMLGSWEDESDNCSSSDAEEAPPMKKQSRSPQSSFPETQQQSEGEKLTPMKTYINKGFTRLLKRRR